MDDDSADSELEGDKEEKEVDDGTIIVGARGGKRSIVNEAKASTVLRKTSVKTTMEKPALSDETNEKTPVKQEAEQPAVANKMMEKTPLRAPNFGLEDPLSKNTPSKKPRGRSPLAPQTPVKQSPIDQTPAKQASSQQTPFRRPTAQQIPPQATPTRASARTKVHWTAKR